LTNVDLYKKPWLFTNNYEVENLTINGYFYITDLFVQITNFM